MDQIIYHDYDFYTYTQFGLNLHALISSTLLNTLQGRIFRIAFAELPADVNILWVVQFKKADVAVHNNPIIYTLKSTRIFFFFFFFVTRTALQITQTV